MKDYLIIVTLLHYCFDQIRRCCVYIRSMTHVHVMMVYCACSLHSFGIWRTLSPSCKPLREREASEDKDLLWLAW